MLGYKRIVIAQNERGLHLHNRRLVNILGPGVFRILDPLGRHEVQLYDLTVAEFSHPWLDVLLSSAAELVAEYFQVVEMGDRQVGLVYKSGRLDGVLPPATRRAYWKGPVEVRVGKGKVRGMRPGPPRRTGDDPPEFAGIEQALAASPLQRY